MMRTIFSRRYSAWFVFILCAVVYLLYQFLAGELGLRQLFRMRSSRDALQRDLVSLRSRQSDLAQHIYLLKQVIDVDVLDEVLKNQLGYVHPKGVVFLGREGGK